MTEAIAFIKKSLQPLYSEEEIRSLTSLILEHATQRPRHLQLINKDNQLSATEKREVYRITDRLTQLEPIQYIIGETLFFNLLFRVNPSVLIPRPETEELVDLIVKQYQQGQPCRILDIGTGSGCIAVSLASALKESTVKAIDISPEALSVARDNAQRNGVDVAFIQGNILEPGALFPQIGTIDILVSNPPYVTEKEKQDMQPHVLNHEPHTALFVPDTDPLLFYRAIASMGRRILSPAGKIYFEINQQYGEDIRRLMEKEGYTSVELKNDLFGHPRFIVAAL